MLIPFFVHIDVKRFYNLARSLVHGKRSYVCVHVPQLNLVYDMSWHLVKMQTATRYEQFIEVKTYGIFPIFGILLE